MARGGQVTLSVIVPALNEEATIERCLNQVLKQDFISEVVVVDDGSVDSTAAIVESMKDGRLKLLRHPRNLGKGAAIRSGLRLCNGEFVAIQDADLEYDPHELRDLLGPLIAGDADVVYGSRFLPTGARRALYFWHSAGNKMLTLASNMASNLNLTDMETCYKVFRSEAIKSLVIEENRFGIEPELTIKAAVAGLRVYEVGISYHGRTYAEGKKIGWRDGVDAARCIVEYATVERVRKARRRRLLSRQKHEQLHGSLEGLRDADNYYEWILGLIDPYLGTRVLEVGAGIGTFTRQLARSGRQVKAAEPDIEALVQLRDLTGSSDSITAFHGFSTDLPPSDVASFDSIVLVNVLEHVEDEVSEMRQLCTLLRPGGHIAIWVPAHELLYAPFDEAVGHFRRYSTRRLTALAQAAGLEVVSARYVNPIGALGWLVAAKLLRLAPTETGLSRTYDRRVVPLSKRLEARMQLPFGQSALLIARRPE